ncbi:MAG: vegetative cell wall protein precursor, partial [Mycobacterium sp.]
MAIFGRNTARQRLRRAAEQSLQSPAFSSPVDCTAWVTGG